MTSSTFLPRNCDRCTWRPLRSGTESPAPCATRGTRRERPESRRSSRPAPAGSATTRWPTRCANAVRLKKAPRIIVFGTGMQMSARQAPCGLSSKPLMRGRSVFWIHNASGCFGVGTDAVERDRAPVVEHRRASRRLCLHRRWHQRRRADVQRKCRRCIRPRGDYQGPAVIRVEGRASGRSAPR